MLHHAATISSWLVAAAAGEQTALQTCCSFRWKVRTQPQSCRHGAARAVPCSCPGTQAIEEMVKPRIASSSGPEILQAPDLHLHISPEQGTLPGRCWDQPCCRGTAACVRDAAPPELPARAWTSPRAHRESPKPCRFLICCAAPRDHSKSSLSAVSPCPSRSRVPTAGGTRVTDGLRTHTAPGSTRAEPSHRAASKPWAVAIPAA